MTKQGLIQDLRDIRASWDSLLAGLSEDELVAHSAPGRYSVAEVVTHLAAWQQVSVARLTAAMSGTEPQYPAWSGGTDPDEAEARTDEFNARIQETSRRDSWLERHRGWQDGVRRLLELAESAPESMLFDSSRYPGMRGYSLSAVLKGWYDHHREHLESVRQRLGGECRDQG